MPDRLFALFARARRMAGAGLLVCLTAMVGVPALRAAIEEESCAERCCQRRKGAQKSCCRRRPAAAGPAMAPAAAACVCDPVAGLGRGETPAAGSNGPAVVAPPPAEAVLPAVATVSAGTPAGLWLFGRPPPVAI